MNDAAQNYFRLVNPAVETDPEFPPQFFGIDEIPLVEISPGVRFRPVFGHNILLNYVYFEPHAEAPLHQHAEEQMGTSIRGAMEFTLNGVTRVLHPGDVYVVPPNVPHAARALDEECIALDIFSPPRSGFRELLDRANAQASKGGEAD